MSYQTHDGTWKDTVSFTLPRRELLALRAKAAGEDRSLSSVVRELIRAGLAAEER